MADSSARLGEAILGDAVFADAGDYIPGESLTGQAVSGIAVVGASDYPDLTADRFTWEGHCWERVIDPDLATALVDGNGDPVAQEQFAARLANILRLNVQNLYVTDEAVIDSAVIGRLFADIFTAHKIGADELAANAVDVGKLRVTEEMAAAIGNFLTIHVDQLVGGSLEGETVYGGTITGGIIKTSDDLPGQVALADNAYVDSGDGSAWPGIRITPRSTSGYVSLPGIGPNVNGMVITGGRDTSGAHAYAIMTPDAVQLNRKGASGTARAGAFSDQAALNFTGTSGEGQVLANQNVVQLSQENASGSAIIQVDSTAAILEKRHGSTGSQLRLEDGGLWYADGSLSVRLNDLWEPTWYDLPIASGWSWPHGYRPAYAVVGDCVRFRGRYGRADGGNFTTSESYTPFTVPPAIRPANTAGGLGNVAGFGGSGSCRLEMSSSGTFTFGVSKNTSWISMDGFSYDLN